MHSTKRSSLIVLLFILCLYLLAQGKKVQIDASKSSSPKGNRCEILRFSYVAYQSSDIMTCASRFSVSTKQSVTVLSKVVAAAMDIKRNPIKLESAVQIIDGSDIQQTVKPYVQLDLQIL